MKKLSIFLMLLMGVLLPWAATAVDLSTYTFSTGQDQSQWITLSSNAQSIVASGDDKASSLTNIGFSFPFGNGTYTQFWANSNGIFSFSSSPATSYSTQYSSSSNVSANQPKICGITKDLCVPSSGGYVKYELTGSGTSHILVCEFYLGATSSASSATLNWQVQLHESGSKVVIVYGAAPSSAPSSYQIGLSASSSDIILVNPSSHTATTTSTYNSTTYSVWPGAYRYYEFAVPTDPYIFIAPTSATVKTGFTETLTVTYGNVTNPTITYSSSDTRVATVTGNGTTATVTGESAGTATITATMTVNGIDYTATCAITVEDPHVCIPTLTGTSTGYYISNFTTTGATTNINNTTSGTSLSYSDYYDTHSASAYEGQTINFTITIAGGSTYGSAIWVDWNNDLEFSSTERVYNTTGYASSPHSGSFTVPTGATLGDHRMRVVIDYYGSNPSDPCSASTGEFEDYKLTVIPQPSCMTPMGLALATDGATVSATWTGTANTYNVEINGTPSPNNPITGTSHTFNVDLSTTYTVRVQANCDGGETSEWTDPVSITTPPCVGGHEIVYNLVDSYGDGWNGNAIIVEDACGIIETLTIDNGTTNSGTLTLCGDYYKFSWQSGSYASETSFTLTDNGVTLYSGQSGSSLTSGQVLHTIGTAPTMLPKPTALTAGTPGRHEVELSWTENGSAIAWEICVNGDEANPVPANTNTNFELNTLTPDTPYTVKVRATNGTNESCWSDEISFTTAEACAKPTSLVASNPTANSIDLTWSGTNDYYEVRYIETMPTTDFEDGFGAWTTIDADGDGFTWLWSGTITGVTGNNGSSYAAYSQSYDNDGEEVLYPDNYLVSPKVQLGGTISFYACAQDANWAAEHFGVAVSTTNNTNASAFTTIQEWTMTASGTGAKDQGTWGLFTVDLSAYSGEGYVAIRHFNCSDKFYLDVDDITITMPDSAPWHTKSNINTNGTTLDNLDGNTTYAIQVRGYCTGEPDPSNWTEAVMETTINGNVFITTGNWNVASNWQGNAVPAAGSDVVIAANVTVPATYVADAGMITFENSATITVADGGQLKTTYGGVNVTMEKTITGYGSANAESKLGYYLLANPVKADQDPSTLGMTTGNYDLYYFDLNCDGTYDQYGNVSTSGTDGNEWRNYETNAFDLVNGEGYLYANESNVPLSITGEIYPTNANIKVTMHYDASAEFPGMNLIGNPYTCNAYLADGRAFYVMDPVAGDIVTGSGAIAPMQGVFVEASAVGNLNFTTTAPANNDSKISINVLRQNALVDRAVVNFGEGQGLSKFQLNRNHTKIYMPVENNDYAVVYTEEQGTMPVNFKAEENGSYTLSFNTENVELGYLHLIDNMTGNDVDLLKTPSYSFDAKTTDYESRFKLVFATGNNADDTFAFFSNGSFVINNEGEATLQVIDINGRIMMSESINGCTNINVNAAQGIYMLRLVNGDNVKVQKVVVR